MPSSNGSIDPSVKLTSPFVTHARTGATDSIPQSSTARSAVDAQPSTPPGPDTAAADNDADNEADSDPIEHSEKALDAGLPPPPREAFSGPQSAPSIPLRPSKGQAADPSDPLFTGSSAPHSTSYPPHATAMHEPPPSASRMPSTVAMPTADAITAAQGGQSSSSAGLLAGGSPPQHAGPILGQPIPPMMMASLGYPGPQAYGMPLPVPSGSGREVYPYGGMMRPMMPGMMLPPPPQQQNRGGRGGRASTVSANPAGLFWASSFGLAVLGLLTVCVHQLATPDTVAASGAEAVL